MGPDGKRPGRDAHHVPGPDRRVALERFPDVVALHAVVRDAARLDHLIDEKADALQGCGDVPIQRPAVHLDPRRRRYVRAVGDRVTRGGDRHHVDRPLRPGVAAEACLLDGRSAPRGNIARARRANRRGSGRRRDVISRSRHHADHDADAEADRHAGGRDVGAPRLVKEALRVVVGRCERDDQPQRDEEGRDDAAQCEFLRSANVADFDGRARNLRNAPHAPQITSAANASALIAKPTR